MCVLGWGAVEQAGRKKQSNSLTASCTACVSLKCVSPTWKLLAALTSARKLFLKDVICLQLAELVWLKRWSEFVNFVPEEYPDLIAKKISFNKYGS